MLLPEIDEGRVASVGEWRPMTTSSAAANTRPATAPDRTTAMPFGIVVACLVLVALGLRPDIVSIGPVASGHDGGI